MAVQVLARHAVYFLFFWQFVCSMLTELKMWRHGCAGVGGHGGMGIHADIQDKYGEVLQRVAMHASPTLAPCINLRQDAAHNTQQQLRQQGDSGDVTLRGDVTFRAADISLARPVSIGSMSDHSPRSFHNRSEPSMDVLLSRINDSDITPPPRALRPVEEAHVTKCVVCVIL